MKELFENFRQYLDADDDEVVGLSYSQMVQELNKKMPRRPYCRIECFIALLMLDV